jgi:hypothetical protein
VVDHRHGGPPPVARQRLRTTRRPSSRDGKVAYRGGYTAAENDADLAKTPTDLGLWLDPSPQTPQETVREILERAHAAVVLDASQ